MNGLFNPSDILLMGPGFVLNRFPSVITGVIVGYTVLLLLCGDQPAFLSRLIQISGVLLFSYVVSKLARRFIQFIVSKVEPPVTPSCSEEETTAPTRSHQVDPSSKISKSLPASMPPPAKFNHQRAILEGLSSGKSTNRWSALNSGNVNKHFLYCTNREQKGKKVWAVEERFY